MKAVLKTRKCTVYGENLYRNIQKLEKDPQNFECFQYLSAVKKLQISLSASG